MKNIKWVGSPNYSETRFGETIDRIVVHWIVGKLESADATFKNPASQVSAHFAVGDDEVHQYVMEDDTAWHSGNWLMNNRSLGIEHEGGPNLPISDKTYTTSAQLIKELSIKYNIPLDREHIIKHSEVKATACPGTLDLDRLIALAKGEDMDCEKQIEELEKELDEMRESRNKWRRMHEELEEKYSKEVLKLNQDLEQARKDNSEIRSDLTECRVSLSKSVKRIEELEAEKKRLEDIVEPLRVENERLSTRLDDLQARYDEVSQKRLLEFSWFERFKSLFRRG